MNSALHSFRSFLSEGPVALFVDIDGTLITHEQRIPTSALHACRSAQEKGHHLFLSSGRSLPEIYPRLWDLGFSGFIGGGGAYVRVADQVLQDERLSSQQITALDSLLSNLNAVYLWQGVDAMHPSPGFIDFFTHAMDKPEAAGWREYNEVITPFIRQGTPDTITKCTAYIPACDNLLDILTHHLPDGIRYIPGSIAAGNTTVAEFMPSHISKGASMGLVCDYLGIARQHSVAIGDSHNDIEALQVAGCGVAMGQAPTQVREAADYVTAPVTEDGLAQALTLLGLAE
ncbi:Cof-type HAD-IIB family hydrolase [Schaalia sp. lx-260]|uniref:Cof-type HAD-IIB family hydrolase n=1 Tax=Schaalia sp. lx-260 TaxID=2899082 RepID=UPI001E3C4E5F|nr:Cof-type HAD-IIB family hydrolase [Schaalia sp. lx-260]MCD4549525.1 HAD family hydrolase [Schaalia sp. lx-260]